MTHIETTLIFGVLIVATNATAARSSQDASEVVIQEDRLPESPWRAFGGQCSGIAYEVSIWPGKKLGQSLRDLKVDNHSVRQAALEAMALWSPIEDVPIDAVIDRCEPERARIGLRLVNRKHPKQLQFYYLWLGKDGRIELIGEK